MTTFRSLRPILIVEDNPSDFEAIKRAFSKAGLANPMVRCQDGDDALDYLFKRGDYAQSRTKLPDVILLDLNLPNTDGHEVLSEIKNNDTLKTIPVIVLTSSSDERDIEACYAAGANSYVQKPVDMTRFMEAIERIKEYWFGIVLLPRQ